MEGWRLVAKELNKFTVADLLGKVPGLHIFFDDKNIEDVLEELRNVKRKEPIIDKYLEALRKTGTVVSRDVLAHLNLFYYFLRSTNKTWTIYELINNVVDPGDLPSDPKSIQTALKAELNQASTNVNVAVQLHEGKYWFRIELVEKGKRGKKPMNSIFFCVCNINPDNIAIAGGKAVHFPRVLKALGNVLNFESAKETALKDQSLDGIFKLFYERRNPYVHSHQFDKAKLKPILDDGIRDFQVEEKNERNRYSESKFGVDEIPVVKKLTYKLSTPLGVKSHPEGMPKDKMFNCRVTFEGKDVIRGFQNAVKCGITEPTLPKYIADVRSSGRTNILIRARNNTGT